MPIPRGSLDELYPREPRPTPFAQTVAGHELTGVRMDQRIDLPMELQIEAGVAADRPPILFLHGSPGEWQNWARYLDHPRLQAYGPLIAPDRPGFGGSRPGAAMPSLQRQAALLAGLLDGLPPAIVVGHSLGGAIAARIALDHPERVRGLLLVAASVAPPLEAPRWYNEMGSWTPVRWLLPQALKVSNDELYGLQDELRSLEPVWGRLAMPVTVVQGMKDRLVYPATAEYLDARMRGPRRIERVADQGHLILWEQPDRIVDLLVQLVGDSAPGRKLDAAPDPLVNERS